MSIIRYETAAYALAFVIAGFFWTDARAQTTIESVVMEDEGPTPVDFGAGAGVPTTSGAEATLQLMAAEQFAAPAGPNAKARGVFGPAVPWTLIPLHAALLPDGRVMSYGTTVTGVQSGEFNYDVWDPTLGTEAASHTLLPNTTGTDLFCSAQSILTGSGNVLLTGGDRKVGGVRNFSSADANIFYPKKTPQETDSIAPIQSMLYPRWYPTIVPLPNGERLVAGGREDKGPVAAVTPEVYTEGAGWRTLFGATSDLAFGASGGNWYYPRIYQLPNDPSKLLVLGNEGSLFHIQPAGNGSITKLPQTIRRGGYQFPTAKFAPGKLLSIRANRKVVVVNINGATPQIALTSDISRLRIWSNATVLADGNVFVNGGSAVGNKLVDVAYESETWNPTTGQWTPSATATKPRLYHAISLLLPDATVLTAAGGAPGPVKNLNAEIYYPPYLYDAAGNSAPRPTIGVYPELVKMSDPAFLPAFWMTVGAGDQISRVTLLHTGSVTHSNNMEQSFQELPFTQTGSSLAVTTPRNPNYTVPGYYMLFVFNANGVPSTAKIIKIIR